MTTGHSPAVRTLVKRWGIEVFRVPLISDYLAGSMPRERILQARSPRGIALESRIGHSRAAPV
jgi:hypothetical protein